MSEMRLFREGMVWDHGSEPLQVDGFTGLVHRPRLSISQKIGFWASDRERNRDCATPKPQSVGHTPSPVLVPSVATRPLCPSGFSHSPFPRVGRGEVGRGSHGTPVGSGDRLGC